jgi:hypothetical protein
VTGTCEQRAHAFGTSTSTDTGGEAEVHYQVPCRAHHRSGDLGPGVRAPDQLTSAEPRRRAPGSGGG